MGWLAWAAAREPPSCALKAVEGLRKSTAVGSKSRWKWWSGAYLSRTWWWAQSPALPEPAGDEGSLQSLDNSMAPSYAW